MWSLSFFVNYSKASQRNLLGGIFFCHSHSDECLSRSLKQQSFLSNVPYDSAFFEKICK